MVVMSLLKNLRSRFDERRVELTEVREYLAKEIAKVDLEMTAIENLIKSIDAFNEIYDDNYPRLEPLKDPVDVGREPEPDPAQECNSSWHKPDPADPPWLPKRLGESQRAILVALAAKPLTTPEVAEATRMQRSRVAPALSVLRGQGAIDRQSDGHWILLLGRDEQDAPAPKTEIVPESAPVTYPLLMADKIDHGGEGPISPSLQQFQADGIITAKARYCVLSELIACALPQSPFDLAGLLGVGTDRVAAILENLIDLGFADVVENGRFIITPAGYECRDAAVGE